MPSTLDEYATQAPYPHALLLSQFSSVVAVVCLCCFLILKSQPHSPDTRMAVDITHKSIADWLAHIANTPRTISQNFVVLQ